VVGPEVQISNSGAHCFLFHVHPVLDPAGHIRAVTGHSEQEWEANIWVDPVSVRPPSRSLTGQGGLFRRRKGHHRREIVRNPPCLPGFVQPEIRLRVTMARLVEWRGGMRAQLQSKVRADELSIEEMTFCHTFPAIKSHKGSIQLESIWVALPSFVYPNGPLPQIPPILLS
jgi:hypothetical protein